jgi:hypothetical protein
LRNRGVGSEFGTQLPTGTTVKKIHDKFEVDGTMQNVNRGRCGKSRS